MANVKITELPLLGDQPGGGDLFPIVDIRNTPTTKKITLSGMAQSVVSTGWDVYTDNIYSTGNTVNVNSNLYVTGNTILDNAASFLNNTATINNLLVTGQTEFSGNTLVYDNLTISGVTSFYGITDFYNNLYIDSAITINLLTVTGV